MRPWRRSAGTRFGRGVAWCSEISGIQEQCLKTEDGVRILDKLLAMLERETRYIASLSRSMRLTQQTRVHKATVGRSAAGSRSAYDTEEF